MRPLTRNERLLTIAFGAMIFLFLNLILMRWVSQAMTSARGETSQLQVEIGAARQLLTQRPYWVARQNWMTAHPPAPYDALNSQAKFVQDVSNSVQAQGLKLGPPQPRETAIVGQLAVTKMDLTVTGRLESIVRWVQAIQQPGNYYSIENFTLKQGAVENTMELQVLLGKVFRAGGPAASP
jgi:hypothetical protein